MPVPPRRTYADRADAVADLINAIEERRTDPHRVHEARDAAARAARTLATALRVDGL
jgi:hypothetical protein